MSPESGHTLALPPPWGEFLAEVDNQLPRPIELRCLGGFVLTVLYERPLPTVDIDYVSVVPREEQQTLQTVGGLARPWPRNTKSISSLSPLPMYPRSTKPV